MYVGKKEKGTNYQIEIKQPSDNKQNNKSCFGGERKRGRRETKHNLLNGWQLDSPNLPATEEELLKKEVSFQTAMESWSGITLWLLSRSLQYWIYTHIISQLGSSFVRQAVYSWDVQTPPEQYHLSYRKSFGFP